MTTALHTLAFKAQIHPKHRFQNLYGLLDADRLVQSWGQLNKQSAPGIDGKTVDDYRPRLMSHIDRLSGLLQNKQYRAADIKRVHIPKSSGGQRTLGLPTLDDKIVQQGASQILQSIWEPDFQRCSYGYRPNNSAHQAVHSLMLNLQFKGYGYIVEADIKGFFDNMSHTWLIKPRLQGRAMLIRYADDFVVAFQYRDDARRFYQVLPQRLAKFDLQVAPEKTHLKRFSRFHPSRRRAFQFLGFEFYWDRDRQGDPRLRRVTAPKKHKSLLKLLYDWIKQNRHKRLNRFMPELRRKLIGFRNYFGLPDNSRSVSRLYDFVLKTLYKWLNRRSQR